MSKRSAEDEISPETKHAKENPKNTGLIRLYDCDMATMPWKGRIDAHPVRMHLNDSVERVHGPTGATCTVRQTDAKGTGNFVLRIEPPTAPVAVMSRAELGIIAPLQARATWGCYRLVGDQLERRPQDFFLVMVRPFEASAVPRECVDLRAGDIALCSSLAPEKRFELSRVDLERYSEYLHRRAQRAMPPDQPDAIVLENFSKSNLRLLRDYIKTASLDTFDVTFADIDDVFQLADFFATIGDLTAVKYLDLALAFHIYALRDTAYEETMPTADIFKFTALHRMPYSHAAMCVKYGKELSALVNEFTDEMRVHLVQTLLDLKDTSVETGVNAIRDIHLSSPS